MSTERLFETALGVGEPWYVKGVYFDEAKRTLSIAVDFRAGSRFGVAGVEGQHPVHDTVSKRYRHLNFFQHDCYLEVRVPRVRLPDGAVRQVDPSWAGKLSGFTLLFEALVLALCQAMPFAAVARLVGESWHRVAAIAQRYVELALEQADDSAVRALAIDETSRARGHDYLTLAADAERRAVLFVDAGRGADRIGALAEELWVHHGDPEAIASRALDETRRAEQKSDPALKGLRWALLKDRERLKPEQRAELDALVAQLTTKRTARAWVYREQLREILARKQVNVVRGLLQQWCGNVMRSKVEPMKAVARLVRNHLEGIVAWTRSRQTNGFLEALNGLFQAAKRKARGYRRLATIRTVIFLLAGKLDFTRLNPHVPATLPT